MITIDPWSLVLELADGSAYEPVRVPESATPGEECCGRFVATLVGGAIGDALGRPVERWDRARVRAMYPDGVRDFMPWRGWVSGPIGTITDDTQLSIAVAAWLVDGGAERLPDGNDFGRRIAEWGPVARGAGVGSSTAAANLAHGVPWRESGSPTYGNGVAMRSAAIGLRYQGDLDRIRQAVAISGLVTHRHATAIAGGVVVAAATSYLLSLPRSATFDSGDLLDAVLAPLAGLSLPLHPVGGSDDRATLVELLRQVPGMLDWNVEDVLDHFYNGSAVFESLPTAFWLFCRFGAAEPEETLVAAASGGRDADTIAAIVGNWVGALHGARAFPGRWDGPELEYRDELIELASDLYALWASDQEGAG